MIESLPRGKAYGFDNLMVDGLANHGRIDIRPFSGYWLDIGRPPDFESAQTDFSAVFAPG